MMQQFIYQAVIKLQSAESEFSRIPSHLPGANTISLESKPFQTYDDCVTSCVSLMKAMSDKANAGLDSPIFKVSSEVNPLLSGKETLSKDWGPGELSRVWLYDKSMETEGKIVAIGQAKIFVSRPTLPLLN